MCQHSLDGKVKLVYIGDTFYDNTSSYMSSIYTEDGQRSDWGKVSMALRAGDSVQIRPATKEELDVYYSHADKIIDGWNSPDSTFMPGLGNFDKGDYSPAQLTMAALATKARIRGIK